MIPNVPDSAFDEIFNESTFYDCSPDVDDPDFRGILLNAPKVVFFGEDTGDPRFGGWARMYVCGFCQITPGFVGLEHDFTTAIQLFVVNTKTHQVYLGRFSHRSFRGPYPPKDPSSDWKTVSIGEYFNPNLTKMTDIPKEEADYLVYATLGEYKSNTVTIQLRRKKGSQ